MNVTKCPSQAVWLIGVLAAMLAGCTTIKNSIPEPEDISGKRRQRNEAATRRFEENRDRAEFEAAEAHWTQGDTDGCRAALQRLLERNPNHLDARLAMAELSLNDGRPEEALSYLQPAAETHPDDARVQYAVGLALDSMGRHDAALAYYERAVMLEPHNEVYAVSYQPDLMSPAESEAPSASSAPPREADEPCDAADSFARRNSADPPAPAGRESDRPRMSGSSVYRVQSVDRVERADYVGQTDPADPADDADDAALTSPSASILIQRGAEAIAAGSVAVGRAYFREAAALKPDDPQIPISAAVSSLRHNHPEVAVELLEPAVAALPDSAVLHRILGTAYYRRGDYAASQRALQQALALDKSSALSYFLMACTLVRLGQPEAAEGCFRQARVIDPRYAVPR